MAKLDLLESGDVELPVSPELARANQLLNTAMQAFAQCCQAIDLCPDVQSKLAFLGPKGSAIDAVEQTTMRALALTKDMLVRVAAARGQDFSKAIQSIDDNARRAKTSVEAERRNLRALEIELRQFGSGPVGKS